MATGTKPRPSVSPSPQVLNPLPKLPLPQGDILSGMMQSKPASRGSVQPPRSTPTQQRQHASTVPGRVSVSRSTTPKEPKFALPHQNSGESNRSRTSQAGRNANESVTASGLRQSSHSYRQQITTAFEAPAWLQVLMKIQRGSTPIACLLILGVLVLYGWNVSSQRAWSKAYRELSQLQRQERELIAASESHKHEIVQQAENSKSNLVRQVPANTIFLTPQPIQERSSLESRSASVRQFKQFPLGY